MNIRILSIVILLVLVGASIPVGASWDSAGASDCSSMQVVPFAGGPDWQVLSDGEDHYCALSDNQYYPTDDGIPLAFDRLGDGKTVVTLRRSISNYLDLAIFDSSHAARRAQLTFDQRSKLHPEATFASDDAFYLVAYNTTDNLPSGRRREVPRNVLALYRLVKTDNVETLELIDDSLLTADIEAGALVARDVDGVLICAQSSCRQLTSKSGGKLVPGKVMSVAADGKPLEIIEIAAGDGKAYALAQRVVDDRFAPPVPASASHFFLCDLLAKSACDGLDPMSAPFNLRIVDGKPTLDDARDRASLIKLVYFDLARSGMNGLANLGENNMEGRIAWSQVYYLNGLLSLYDLATSLELPPALKAQVRSRVELEIKALGKIAETPYPGFLVKRYALDREPYASLLHNARVLKVVWRANALIPSSRSDSFDHIGTDTLAAHNAIERFDPANSSTPARGYIRKYFPFWADGARVPWNFQSGWVEAVVWAPSVSKGVRDMAASMIQDFLKTEKIAGGKQKWSYATGTTATGWTAADQVSANTPDYGGDTANPAGAQISYRSMDAMAVLAAMRGGLVPFDRRLLDHLADLVRQGLLYPFVNEELRRAGNEQVIPFATSRLYIRSRLPWQIQNQAWALQAVSQTLLQTGAPASQSAPH